MDTPPGFHVSSANRKVCKLKKALYDLKQSPHAWFERFRAAMINAGYKQTQVDHILFTKRNGLMITALMVYVDDIVVIGNDEKEIIRLKRGSMI